MINNSKLLTIRNQGARVLFTNYWETEYNDNGIFYLSLNAGGFRLFVPGGMEYALTDMKTAKDVVVSRGAWPEMGLTDGIEILFDDHTENPFALHLTTPSCDSLPAEEHKLKEGFTVWTLHYGAPKCRITRPCWFRHVPYIPFMEPIVRREK